MPNERGFQEPQARRPFLRVPPLLGALLLALPGCGDTQESAPAPEARAEGPQASIVETAQVAGQFSALLRAVEAAGLTATLQNDGPFTVFAPTDGAFARLPDGALDDLLQDPEALAEILLYHVVSGEYTQEELRDLDSLQTVQGGTLALVNTPQGLLIGGSNILTANVRARNGIIHVITEVLIP
jgi:uncharacterized surface protein with fasciclin (FAS1) repeats